MKHVIALDVGGTGRTAALSADAGARLHESRPATGRR
ncbi:ROK family protein, partial [Streptomyces vinaceus]